MAYDLSDEEGLPASLQQHSKVVFRCTAGRKRLVPLVNLKGLEVSEDFGVIGMAWVEPRHLVAHPGTTDLDLRDSRFVFSRKLMRMPELVAKLDRLQSRQQRWQAQLPELQPNLWRKAMTLPREVKLDSSAPGSSCWVLMRKVFPSLQACYHEMVPALENQDLAATMPDPREFWRCGPEDPTTEFEEVLEFQNSSIDGAATMLQGLKEGTCMRSRLWLQVLGRLRRARAKQSAEGEYQSEVIYMSTVILQQFVDREMHDFLHYKVALHYVIAPDARSRDQAAEVEQDVAVADALAKAEAAQAEAAAEAAELAAEEDSQTDSEAESDLESESEDAAGAGPSSSDYLQSMVDATVEEQMAQMERLTASIMPAFQQWRC